MGGESAAKLVSQPPRWSRGDSNPGPPPCKGGALPAKLRPPVPILATPPARIDTATPARVGAPGLEPGTSALSGPRSNRLSYAPAGAAVSHSSTAAGPPQDSLGRHPPYAQDGARGSSLASIPRHQGGSAQINTSSFRQSPAWRLRPPRHPWRPCQVLRPSRDGKTSGLGAHRCRIITRKLDKVSNDVQRSDDLPPRRYSLERR